MKMGAGIHMSSRLTKEHENTIHSPLWKRGMKGDFKKKCFHAVFVKSPLTPFAKEGDFRVNDGNDNFLMNL